MRRRFGKHTRPREGAREVSFSLAGVRPGPSGSKVISYYRSGPSQGRAFIRPASKYQEPFQEAVAEVARAAMEGKELLEGPVALEVFIYWKRPGKHYIGNLESKTSKARKAVKPGTPWIPETRPDTTKLFRAVEDALLKIVFNDDSQVSRILVEKIYADDWFVDVRCYELEPYPHD